MAAENIGELVPTKIPGYADSADIQAALRLYHYGSYTFDVNETNAANLINPSIAYSLNNLQSQVTNIDLTSTIQKSYLSAKGDLISASADNTPSLLNVGTNGQVLTANSATSSGLEWTTPDVTLTNTVTLSNKTLSSPVINVSFNQQTGTTYSVALADNGKIVEVLNSSPITVSIPTNSTAFPIGAQITVIQTGTGQITFAATTPATTTVNATPGLKLRAQWSSAVLIKRDTEQWVVLGDLVA
jgi:arylamine N-acetyltransferase